MANTVNDFTFQNFNTNISYSQYDVVYGINGSDTKFYYATQASQGKNPIYALQYTVTGWERTDDLTTVYFNKTGSQPDFEVGSEVRINCPSQTSINYTGLAIYGGSNTIKYINPGWDNALTSLAGADYLTTVTNPAWTSGFGWTPSNGTSVDFMTKRDFAQFGDGYTAQGRLGINSIGSVINMSFNDRSYKESRAILNYVQSMGGVVPVKINFPTHRLFNNPYTKYLLTDPKITMSSYNLNNVTVTATRVYNP